MQLAPGHMQLALEHMQSAPGQARSDTGQIQFAPGHLHLPRGRLDMDRGIGVLEQGRFHLERGRLDVDQDIGDLHQGTSILTALASYSAVSHSITTTPRTRPLSPPRSRRSGTLLRGETRRNDFVPRPAHSLRPKADRSRAASARPRSIGPERGLCHLGPSMCQSRRVSSGRLTICEMVAPFMTQIASAPVAWLRHTMSGLPSPL